VANLPRGVMMEEITLDQAVALLAEKGKQLRPRGTGGRRGRTTAAAKPEPAAAPPAKAKAKPAAKRRATKAKRAAPKLAAKTAPAGKTPAKKKAAARGKKAAAGTATQRRV
jgi:DNA topoisomerase-1